MLDNNGFEGSETLKDSILMNKSNNKLGKEYKLGKTLAAILENMREVPEEPSGGGGFINPPIVKPPVGGGIIEIPQSEPPTIQSGPIPPGIDDNTKIIKGYEGLFRSIKNNPWSLLKIHNVNLDGDNLTVQLNPSDKTFNK